VQGVASRRNASVTLHVTVVLPRTKGVPLAGVQAILKGGSPAMTLGGS
jgi:hypothetical protein